MRPAAPRTVKVVASAMGRSAFAGAKAISSKTAVRNVRASRRSAVVTKAKV